MTQKTQIYANFQEAMKFLPKEKFIFIEGKNYFHRVENLFPSSRKNISVEGKIYFHRVENLRGSKEKLRGIK
jgi:hypothetical protein